MRQLILNIFFLFLTIGCASKEYSIDELFEDGGEIDTTPEDSIKYVCNQKKYFFVRYIGDDKKNLWVIFPKREIKLDQTEISNVFSNGITKLVFNEKTTTIKEEDSILYSECSSQIK
tara:strand:- start:184 stop:534 length:351 start_codon:yes stop_codon:yes gene_type:complete